MAHQNSIHLAHRFTPHSAYPSRGWRTSATLPSRKGPSRRCQPDRRGTGGRMMQPAPDRPCLVVHRRKAAAVHPHGEGPCRLPPGGGRPRRRHSKGTRRTAAGRPQIPMTPHRRRAAADRLRTERPTPPPASLRPSRRTQSEGNRLPPRGQGSRTPVPPSERALAPLSPLRGPEAHFRAIAAS